MQIFLYLPINSFLIKIFHNFYHNYTIKQIVNFVKSINSYEDNICLEPISLKRMRYFDKVRNSSSLSHKCRLKRLNLSGKSETRGWGRGAKGREDDRKGRRWPAKNLVHRSQHPNGNRDSHSFPHVVVCEYGPFMLLIVRSKYSRVAIIMNEWNNHVRCIYT